MSKSNQNLLTIRIYLLAALAGGFLSLGLLFQNPSDSDTALLLGLSTIRLIMALGLVLWVAGLSFMLRRLITNSHWAEEFIKRINRLLGNGIVYALILILSLFTLLIASQLWHLSQISPDPYVSGYLGRLEPVLVFLGLLSLQNLILLPFIRYGRIPACPSKKPKIALYAFSGMSLFAAVIAISRIGIEPDLIGWDPPGVPVLAAQVWLIGGIGLLFLGLENLFFRRCGLLFDLLLSLMIWGTASTFWGGQTISADYFALEPVAPNFEFYPYSDAATHDVMAQGLLLGEGYPGIARKPLYAAFLALLHEIVGQDYDTVAMAQVMVIALLPVCLYWLARSLHRRASGLVVALLIILRERNALVLSGVIGVSHAKLLMSDLPSTLGVVLLTMAILAWLRNPDQRRVYPLMIGGILGTLLLVRPQITVFVPVAILGMIVLFLKRLRMGMINIALFALGLALALFPWVWRSYQISGQFAINDPAQNAFLTQQYSLTPGQGRLKPLPGESEGEFSQRVDAYLRDFMLSNPGYVTSFVGSHFVHNLVEMVITLPMTPWIVQDASSDLFPYWSQQSDRLWNSCCSLKSYVEIQPFWNQWLGEINIEIAISTLINLAILAIGFGVAVSANGIVGLIPLGVGLVYVMSTALGRYSGWRLLLPADWMLFLYFGIGLAQTGDWLLRFYTGQTVSDQDENLDTNIWQRMSSLSPGTVRDYQSGIVVGIIFLAVGLSPWMIERLIPQKYALLTREDMAVYVEESPEISQFLEIENGVLLHGRALYPRFYRANKGEPGGDWPAFSPREFSRLGFVLVGPQYAHVVLPASDAPEFFPHASDAIVLGCPAEEHVRAKLVVLIAEDGYTLVPSSDAELSCTQP